METAEEGEDRKALVDGQGSAQMENCVLLEDIVAESWTLSG